ncbi:outer membrane beta-barrel protein, partial [Candidatus Symbiothrix dinenymphae]|uniref:outer membrane beta-barrel protein n=1 Tax=Candidatus Symbiothrix dinenymphae TaxID=467085 RepID=UPI000AB5A64F
MSYRTVVVIAAMCYVVTVAMAQQSRHEFSFVAGGGLSTLNYTPAAGNANLGFGGFAGLGYTFRFSEHWGIGTGVEAALFNAQCTLNPLSETYLRNDGTEDFDYTYTLSGYHDKQQAILLNIPLMLHFQTGRFYAALGGKAGIPLSAKFNSSADKLTTSGKYASGDYVLNKPKFKGLGEFSDLNHQGDLALKTAFFASAEAGIRWRLNDKFDLSTGLYVDYGINSIHPAATTPLIDYSGSADYRPNSAIASTNAGKPVVDKLTPLAAGLKIGLIFGTAKPPKSPPEGFPAAPATSSAPPA